MVGIVTRSVAVTTEDHPPLWVRVRDTAHEYRYFLLFVILPTLVAAIYLYGVASDQYESSGDFVVRQAEKGPVPSDMGQMLGMSFGGGSVSSEAHLVADYLQSHEAVARLRKENSLVERFRRPEIDPLSKLRYADPKAEQLLKYYRKQVRIQNDPETGISHITVHAFTPADARDIAAKLLLLGEERINALNERTYRDAVSHSESELRRAEEELAQAEIRMTAFRRQAGDIDPKGSGTAQISLVSGMTAELSGARAKLQSIRQAVGTDSPQYRAMAAQVASLEAQVAGQSSRIAGNDSSIANKLGTFENLVVRREAAAKVYAAANGSLEMAKAEATRKQTYLVRVVDVNTPAKSEFPKRGKILLTLFFGLALAYAILKMILAGIREHHI